MNVATGSHNLARKLQPSFLGTSIENLPSWKAFPTLHSNCLLKYPSERRLQQSQKPGSLAHQKLETLKSLIMEHRTWEEMQIDCLVNIFSRLSLVDLTTAIPFVCKSWNQASVDPLCSRILDFRYIEFDPSSPLASRFGFELSVPRFSFSGFLKLSLARARGAVSDLRFTSLFAASCQDISLVSDE